MEHNIAHSPERLPLENDRDNPYWIINQDELTSKTKRITGGISANYKITSWWDVTARLGYDQYTTNDYTYIAPGSAVLHYIKTDV